MRTLTFRVTLAFTPHTMHPHTQKIPLLRAGERIKLCVPITQCATLAWPYTYKPTWPATQRVMGVQVAP